MSVLSVSACENGRHSCIHIYFELEHKNWYICNIYIYKYPHFICIYIYITFCCYLFSIQFPHLCSNVYYLLLQIGCKLADIFKQGNEPFLAVLVSQSDDKGRQVQQIFFGCEKQEVCEVKDIVSGLALLISSYFAFNIEYAKGKNFLKFVQEFLLGMPIQGEKHSPRYCQFSKQIKISWFCNNFAIKTKINSCCFVVWRLATGHLYYWTYPLIMLL